MKKLLSISALALISMLNAYAAGQGKFIHVDNTTAKNIKPQLAFYQERVNGEDITTLLVWTTNVNSYYEFTNASRILIRFSDGTMTRLSLDTNKEIKKDKFTKKNANATITYYKTITSYAITPELIDKLENNIAITKIRVVFKENEAKDYDIAEAYQTKMASDLKQSYLDASQRNRQTTGDLSDEDF